MERKGIMTKKRLLSCLILSCLIAITLHPTASAAKTNIYSRTSSEFYQGESDYYLNVSKTDLLVNETFSLEVYGVTDEEISFRSEDSSIASVGSVSDNRCTVSGNGVGTTTITVKVRQKSAFFFMRSTTTLRCKINVTPAAASVRFKKSTYRMNIGKKKKLKINLRPTITTEKPVFASSNQNVATVSKTGKVKALSAGTTSITATISNGMVAKCQVIVKAPASNKKALPQKKK